MNGITTDPNHHDLTHGVDDKPVEQAKVYLVLSDEERAKGFVRPVRHSYVHVGLQPAHPLRDLTAEEANRYASYDYVKFEAYPHNPGSSITGRYWTKKQLSMLGCGALTKMADSIAETYARDPRYYGSTYCCTCRKHLPVEEFVWEGTDEKVGS